MSSALLDRGIRWVAYPERTDPRPGAVEKVILGLAGPLGRAAARARRWRRLVADVDTAGERLRDATRDDVRDAADGLRARLRSEGFTRELTAQSFALVREVATRTIGQRHFGVQLIGGAVLLHGMVAEMETGEGKTLTATLAACTAALAGLPTHVITVNDYLASRDADWMRPLYEALGLTVGTIVHDMPPPARRAAYAADVTYCSNKELAFDYLRDRIVLGREPDRIQLQLERVRGDGARLGKLLLRGLYFGIVDEADSVLVDEARTPLIISGGSGETPGRRVYEQALALAAHLEEGRDFVLDHHDRATYLTSAGRGRLAEVARPLRGAWRIERRREELVVQAITAQRLFHRDKEYLVKDGKVQIVDEYTGRVSADRSWERGLHQAIEVKEGCELSEQTHALARISYQRFFRRYLRLAGMTGTAREVTRELWSVYRLAVMKIATNRPVARRALPDRVHVTAEEKWQAVLDRIVEVSASGRPVLVGTRSVAASEHLSRLLTAANLSHHVLNARQDREEAAIVACAGEPGRITVATNMAGRGTDIKLSAEVVARGGLHVIATERHESGRIDRQLFGRCGRQGDPGSSEAIIALDDELVTAHVSALRRHATIAVVRSGQRLSPWLAGRTLRRAQKAAERLHSRMRRDLLRADEQLETLLAFSGRPE